MTGERLFKVESGIIATWVKNVGEADLTEAFPYRPGLVGQPDPEIVLGKGSGLDSVAIWLSRNGIDDANPKEIEEILREVKVRSLEKKALLTNEEFLDIVERTIPNRERPSSDGCKAGICQEEQIDEGSLRRREHGLEGGHQLGERPRLSPQSRPPDDGAARARGLASLLRREHAICLVDPDTRVGTG